MGFAMPEITAGKKTVISAIRAGIQVMRFMGTVRFGFPAPDALAGLRCAN